MVVLVKDRQTSAAHHRGWHLGYVAGYKAGRKSLRDVIRMVLAWEAQGALGSIKSANDLTKTKPGV